MKTKRKSAFKTILGFEYISVIKNKAFIISTILVVATLILTSFLPALIIGLTSSDSSDEETEKPKIAVVNKAYEKDDVIVKAITDNFNGYDVESIKSESDAQKGVKDGLYSFSIILNKPPKAPRRGTVVRRHHTVAVPSHAGRGTGKCPFRIRGR